MRIVTSILCFSILLFTSCARIFNGKKTNIRIITDKETVLVINNDSIQLGHAKIITVPRSDQPLVFETINQDSSYKHHFQAINSFAYYLNIMPYAGYGLGFLLDANSYKRYTYPQKIWIKNNKAFDYNHKRTNFKFDNIIKATFNNVMDFNDFIEPSVYYERRLNSFSSATIGFGIPVYSLGRTQNLRGYRIGYEHKFFFRQNAPLGSYIGLEFNHFASKYLSDIRFVNEEITYDTDQFGLALFFNTIFDADHRSYREWVRLNKKTYTFNIKYGFQQKINRVMFDFSVGLGLKNRDIKHIGRFRPQDEIYRSWFDIFNEKRERMEGNSWSLTLPLSLKIGYSF